MDSQDYPIQHFDRMTRFATALKQLSAQLLEHQYSYEAMGSWATILRFRGVAIRVVGDGREGDTRIELSRSRDKPYDWYDARVLKGGDSELIADESFLKVLRELVQEQ